MLKHTSHRPEVSGPALGKILRTAFVLLPFQFGGVMLELTHVTFGALHVEVEVAMNVLPFGGMN